MQNQYSLQRFQFKWLPVERPETRILNTSKRFSDSIWNWGALETLPIVDQAIDGPSLQSGTIPKKVRKSL